MEFDEARRIGVTNFSAHFNDNVKRDFFLSESSKLSQTPLVVHLSIPAYSSDAQSGPDERTGSYEVGVGNSVDFCDVSTETDEKRVIFSEIGTGCSNVVSCDAGTETSSGAGNSILFVEIGTGNSVVLCDAETEVDKPVTRSKDVETEIDKTLTSRDAETNCGSIPTSDMKVGTESNTISELMTETGRLELRDAGTGSSTVYYPCDKHTETEVRGSSNCIGVGTDTVSGVEIGAGTSDFQSENLKDDSIDLLSQFVEVGADRLILAIQQVFQNDNALVTQVNNLSIGLHDLFEF